MISRINISSCIKKPHIKISSVNKLIWNSFTKDNSVSYLFTWTWQKHMITGAINPVKYQHTLSSFSFFNRVKWFFIFWTRNTMHFESISISSYNWICQNWISLEFNFLLDIHINFIWRWSDIVKHSLAHILTKAYKNE